MPFPQIPAGLFHSVEQVIERGHHDQANGGQWVTDELTTVIFQGVILPVGSRELQYAPAGTFTKDSHILYTNGHAVEVGAQIHDGVVSYTVVRELTHSPLHPMKRYMVESKGGTK